MEDNDVFFFCSLLSLYDGVKLLELLADKIHLTTSSFINIRYTTAPRVCQCFETESYIYPLDAKVSLWLCVASVVGPALTFRIHQNERNMTAAEVAAKAGEAENTHTHTHTHADTFPYPHI